jgi:hypothetical protein
MNEPLDSGVKRSPVRKAMSGGQQRRTQETARGNIETSFIAVFFTALDYVLSDLRKK